MEMLECKKKNGLTSQQFKGSIKNWKIKVKSDKHLSKETPKHQGKQVGNLKELKKKKAQIFRY